MRELFSIDLKDYPDNCSVFRRPSARGIILKGNKICLVYSEVEKYYKFPGGGIHEDEDKETALSREVKEETGLVVIPDTIREFGRVLRRQKGKEPGVMFEQENFYYTCEVYEDISDQNLDDYEKEAGFVLHVVDIDEAIATNDAYAGKDLFHEIMIKRENRVLNMIKEELL